MAHNLKVLGSMPDPIEVSTLRQGAYTNCASLHPGVYMGTWSVVMSAVCGCTLLYANMHYDQGVLCKVDRVASG